MALPTSVKLVEVSPRDGLQNEADFLATETKVELINRLSATGLRCIEVTSFVRAPKIPQLVDCTEVYQQISPAPDVDYPVLVPNLKGFQDAVAAGATSIAVFTAASELFNQNNINASIAQSFERMNEFIPEALRLGMRIRGYISCIAGCPYEGEINVDKVVACAKQLQALGCHEISLGDTTGVGTPAKIQTVIDAVSKVVPLENLALHCHDTYGQALANIFAALEKGIQIFDSSIGGLGGCPYARGANGNVATEDVLYLLNGLDIATEVNLPALLEVDKFICKALNRTSHSKVFQATSCNI